VDILLDWSLISEDASRENIMTRSKTIVRNVWWILI